MQLRHSAKSGVFEMLGIVYLLANQINGKAYVGQTIQSIGARVWGHRLSGDPFPICRALKKYGPCFFDGCVLETCRSQKELDRAEAKWIKHFGSIVPAGYNLATGGGGSSGYKLTDEQLALRSTSRLGENNPNYGNHSSWSQSRRDAQPKEHHSTRPEVRANLSAGLKRSWANKVFDRPRDPQTGRILSKLQMQIRQLGEV